MKTIRIGLKVNISKSCHFILLQKIIQTYIASVVKLFLKGKLIVNFLV